jgi:hypothetical protein
MRLPITIEFLDGSSETYIVQPPEWVKWEAENFEHHYTSFGENGNLGLYFLSV